mgnify:FL=1
MTENYLTSITPDSMSGLVFAFEGISKGLVLMNGPTGCKFYHSATSDNQMIRQPEFDPLEYPEFWYFGQPRVPSTFLDKRDYVYGSEDKLSEVIAFLEKEIDFDLLAIVNTPGAALIGDDIERIAREASKDESKIISIGSPGYSLPIWDGYIKACRILIEKLAKPGEKPAGKSVNILGLSIFHRDFAGDKEELQKALALCEIDVNCFLCAGSSVSDIEKLPRADLNIVVDSLYGLDSAKLLSERFDMPYIVCDGLPVGFRAMEKLLQRVCEKLGSNITAYMKQSERARAKCFAHLSRVHTLTGRPKGVKFAVHGSLSQCLGYTEFLASYFGMTCDVVSIVERKDLDDKTRNYEELAMQEARLREILNDYGSSDALKKNIFDTDAELVFADGQTIAMLRAKGKRFSGIETALPSLGYIDVIEKSHLGIGGGLLLCEQVLNGMLY